MGGQMRSRDSKIEFNFMKTLIIYPLMFLIFLVIVHYMIGFNKPRGITGNYMVDY
jgi:hypothetical protein